MIPSPFLAKYSTEHLQRALEARKRELDNGSTSRRTEAARAIGHLERELEARGTLGEDEKALGGLAFSR